MNTNSERWRKTALKFLPMYSELIGSALCHVDLWQELKELVADENSTSGIESQRPIFAYAWWCVDESNDPDLITAVETCFYQDLPAYSDTRGKIEHFIDQHQFNRLRKLFAARVDEEEFHKLFAKFIT